MTILSNNLTVLFRPARCSKKYERIFIEWDRMERAFLQPCGFYDPEIPMGGPPRKGIDLFTKDSDKTHSNTIIYARNFRPSR